MTDSHDSTQADPHGGHTSGHAHPSYLAHHFEGPDQQFGTGKLGMWLFLGTEILMFGGLFCWYSIWRHNHYDSFQVGHQYLVMGWGALNTLVLIASSFTMAWAVRAMQLGRDRACWILLGLTFLGGLIFMCVKYVEYSGKFAHHMGPGLWYHAPEYAQKELDEAQKQIQEQTPAPAHAGSAPAVVEPGSSVDMFAYRSLLTVTLPAGQPPAGLKPAAAAPDGHGSSPGHTEGTHSHYFHTPDELKIARPFFSIYFCMTGLHGLHVLVGLGLIAWIMVKVKRGRFSAAYNQPVDLVGLYWHLVDLIWIFLFPLLYLIG